MMADEYINRTEALKDFDACNADNPKWTPARVKALLIRQSAVGVAGEQLLLLPKLRRTDGRR